MHSVFVPRIDAFHSVRNGRAVNWHWSSWQKHDRPRYVYDRAVSPDVHSCPTFCFYSFLLPVSITFLSPPPLRFPFSLLLDLFLPCFFFSPVFYRYFRTIPFLENAILAVEMFRCYSSVNRSLPLPLLFCVIPNFQISKVQFSSILAVYI